MRASAVEALEESIAKIDTMASEMINLQADEGCSCAALRATTLRASDVVHELSENLSIANRFFGTSAPETSKAKAKANSKAGGKAPAKQRKRKAPEAP